MKRKTFAVTGGVGPGHPELKELVWEASHALARLDTARLEELALSCQALNRELAPDSSTNLVDYARQAREAREEMAVFARVMEATRANLNVMKRLRELRDGRLEYCETQMHTWVGTESGNGNH
jgi:hypothetical protein